MDALSKAAYDAAIRAHDLEVAPTLQRLDAALQHAAVGDIDPATAARLKTMRAILTSGLFDPEFYLEKYPDIRAAGVDPLEHYVAHGDAEMRRPNPAFLPRYYRQHQMTEAAAEENALAHYIEKGEQSGGKPNGALDPRIYLADNPELAEFVDRPLFHYLKIGQAAGGRVRAIPLAAILPALEYRDAIDSDGKEHHLLLRTAKRALVQRFGVQEGFASYSRIIGRPDHAELHLKRIESLRDAGRARPGIFHEMAPAGEPVCVPPPAIIGAADCPPLRGHARSMYVACLIDARVRARSCVIEVGDVAVVDYEDDELRRIDERLDYDPSVFDATTESAWIMTPTGDSGVIEIAEAFNLLGVRPDAFGHWMIEYLPKYIGAALSGALPRVPLLIDAGLPESLRDMLELLLPEGVEIIELAPFTVARVRRLWCAPGQTCFPLYETDLRLYKWEYFLIHPARFAPIVREMARRFERAAARPTGVERLFLARDPSQWHKLVNCAAIEAAASARGFAVVYPQRLAFVEQARFVRHADYIIGPDGSQMFLAFFARPGTKLSILSNPEGIGEIQAENAVLYQGMGVDCTVLTGPAAVLDEEAPWESDYEIDEEAFCNFLDSWLAQGTPPQSTEAADTGCDHPAAASHTSRKRPSASSSIS